MDPASIVGLTAAIQQLLALVYQYRQGVRDAKDEINPLCSELLALKAALDHVQLQLDAESLGATKDSQSTLLPSNSSTPEFEAVFSANDNILKDLLARPDRKDSKDSKIKSSL